MKNLLTKLRKDMQLIQQKIQPFTPWLFGFSACAKIVIIALLAFSPKCAEAQSLPKAEQQALTQKVESYLNGITTMKAQFSQATQDGSITGGMFYLWRPGRLRFEYDVPRGADGADYIVADGRFVNYWDHAVKNYSNAPIGSTLADFLLRKRISLSGDLKVKSVARPSENRLLLTLIQADTPEAGDVRMLFTENPLQLQKWRVTDASGSVTEVSLSEIETGTKLDPRLFVFKAPKGHGDQWGRSQ